jgi:hypothetical protein
MDHHRKLLELLSQSANGRLGYQQSNRMSELASVLVKLGMNSAGAHHLLDDESFAHRVVLVMAELYHLDLALIGAQAQLLLARMEAVGGLGPYFALFSQEGEVEETDWSSITDPDEALRVLTRMFTLAPIQARTATIALWGTPHATAVGIRLRDLLPDLDDYAEQQEYVALTLVSLQQGPEPQCWLDDPQHGPARSRRQVRLPRFRWLPDR